MTYNVFGDSTMQGMAPRIAAALGVPSTDVRNFAQGGQTSTDCLRAVKAHGAGGDNIVRTGHQAELRLGQTGLIISNVWEMYQTSRTLLVIQHSNADESAYDWTGYEAVSENIALIDDEWSARYGMDYLPLRDLVIAEFLSRHTAGKLSPPATAEELEDCRRRLYPRRWRMTVGNDGHATAEAKDVEARFIAARLILRAGSPTPAPAPTPEPAPAPTSTRTRWQRFLDWLRR